MSEELPEQEPPASFDIFLQNIDVRWCLLLHCNYDSLIMTRQVSTAFSHDVPIVLSSKEWCASVSNSAALHAAQWAAGGEDVLHKALSKQLGQTIVRLHCPDDDSRQSALVLGAQLDTSGNPIMVLRHPVGAERMLSAAQLVASAPPMAPFLRDPLVRTTTVVEGATHQNGAVQTVSAAADAIPCSEQGAAAVARGMRAHRARYLVASGGLDRISCVWSVRPTALSASPTALSLRAMPLSVQGALRHAGALSAVEVRSSGELLTACNTSSMLRMYELEAAHLAAARIAASGVMPPAMVPTAAQHEWNYVERVRLQHEAAEECVIAAKWVDETTLVEVGFQNNEDHTHVLRTWRVGAPPHRAFVAACQNEMLPDFGMFSSLATGNGLVVVAHNPPDALPGKIDVWRVLTATDADAPPALEPLNRLEEHTAPLYACAVNGGLLATGGDDCTVRLWSAAALRSMPNTPTAGGEPRVASLETLQLPGKVWALALHSHLLVIGGAIAPEAGHICVRLFGVAGLAEGCGAAVALQTLQVPSIQYDWGVRAVATYGGTIVVAGGDDGVVHCWTLAEKEKANRGDGVEGLSVSAEQRGA